MKNYDVFITASAVAALVFFFVVHIIVFRHINKQDAVRWFLFIFCGLGTGLFILDLLITGELFIAFVAATLYALAAGAYFMGVFGLLATSVRIRLLTEIAEAREKGLTTSELAKRYNPAVIVRERLKRFVSSGDITYANGYYVEKRGITFFVLPALVLHLMKILYGTHAEKK